MPHDLFFFLSTVSSLLTYGFRSFSKKTALLWRYTISSHKVFSVLLLDLNIHNNPLIESSQFLVLCIFGNSSAVGYVYKSESQRCCSSVRSRHSAGGQVMGKTHLQGHPELAQGANIQNSKLFWFYSMNYVLHEKNIGWYICYIYMLYKYVIITCISNTHTQESHCPSWTTKENLIFSFIK